MPSHSPEPTLDIQPAPCVDRRAFVGVSLAAVAALLAGCGDGQIGAGGNPLAIDLGGGAGGAAGTGSVLRLQDYPALANVGGMVRLDTQQGPIAVVHTAPDTFAALSLRCPHQGTVVNYTGGGFYCPNHGARFAADGQWQGGQSTRSLYSVPVAYSAADGTLTLGAGTTTTGGTGGGTTGGSGGGTGGTGGAPAGGYDDDDDDGDDDD